jgi:hypothetical protein
VTFLTLNVPKQTIAIQKEETLEHVIIIRTQGSLLIPLLIDNVSVEFFCTFALDAPS